MCLRRRGFNQHEIATNRSGQRLPGKVNRGKLWNVNFLFSQIVNTVCETAIGLAIIVDYVILDCQVS